MAFKPTPNTEYRDGDIVVEEDGEALLLLENGKAWIALQRKKLCKDKNKGFSGFVTPRKQVLNIFDIPREFWAKLANEE